MNSLFNLMIFSVLYYVIIILMQVQTNSSTIAISFHNRKYNSLVRSSLITRIKLYIVLVSGSLDLGSLTIKSNVTIDYALFSVSSVYNSPQGLCLLYFIFLYMLQFQMYLSTSFLSPSYIKSLVISLIVLVISKWPTNLLLCLTIIMSLLFSFSTLMSIIISTTTSQLQTS